MIRGNQNEFIAGKVFKFLGDMTEEEFKKEVSHTKKCTNCGKKKNKEYFQGGSNICIKCNEENE